MNKGLFITFEGGEGSGKSTQIALLETYFTQVLNREVIKTREPGGTLGAEEIRSLLVKGGGARWDRLTELLLFTAARRDHLVQKIWPALQAGKVVLSDRFADSTIAYQCYGYGFDETVYEQAISLYKLIAGNFEPDLTVILDIEPEIGLSRSMKRAGNDEQRFENMDFSFHRNLRNGFLNMAKQAPDRFLVVDANQAPEKVHQDIVRLIEEQINR